MADGKKDVTGQVLMTARAVRGAGSAELAALGLHPGQDTMLLVLRENEGISLKDLAAFLAVRPPTVTKTIARLSAQGFVEKRAGTGDARQNHAFLTTEGRMVAGEVKTLKKRLRKIALKGLDAKEQKVLRKLLRRIEDNLGGAGPGEETP
ncbi:MarR family transcriptional regulator [Fulvimarina endophytica]|uniref:MarR family transcriptional regulator n=1 Tax=Fulvimarina endophytica TaxID=2293836 RepID=A0A371X515_9HYPH|nr:MarR family winged helix-turn-helix transcriptional regulator [Fulvimarina endophytica]RFC64321.1 MarR family transcriptional regulator [Fulvimarina endophytica]